MEVCGEKSTEATSGLYSQHVALLGVECRGGFPKTARSIQTSYRPLEMEVKPRCAFVLQALTG